jgi:pilus assembly protein Flp/PilA
MKKLLVKFIRDEEGAAAAEYALILAIVAVGITLAAKALSDAIADAMDEATTELGGTPAGG